MEFTKSNVLEMELDREAVIMEIDGVTFAQRLREARLAANLTQEQVAEHCGITDGAVSAWERGQAHKIAAETLFCVADMLRVDPRWLIVGETQGGEQSAALAQEIAALPDEQRAAVLALIRSLKR
jgi:transcriptional regulator with XRE-family HTH domain